MTRSLDWVDHRVGFQNYDIQHIWVLFHDFAYFLFMFLFEFLVSFIFWIDSLATRETIIVVSFCLFSCFIASLVIYIYIYIYIGIALPS